MERFQLYRVELFRQEKGGGWNDIADRLQIRLALCYIFSMIKIGFLIILIIKESDSCVHVVI